MERKDQKLSIVIPVFNEEANIDLLIERLENFVNKIEINSEIILVDDHSTDKTSELIQAHCEKISYLKYIRLSKNSGSHVAIIAGFQHATGDCATFLAGDLQDPPELIEKLLEQWLQGYKVVWAVREQRKGVSFFSKLLSALFYHLFNRFADIYYPPNGADFALLDRQVLQALLQTVGSKPSLGGLIVWLGFEQTEVPYIKEARKHGKSKWTLAKKLNAFADAFVGFSYAPLRLMSYSGFMFAFLGFIYAFVSIVLKLGWNAQIPGWTSLMVVILFLGGIQMLMLGVLGEYLWRNLEESRKRPLFIIEKSNGFE